MKNWFTKIKIFFSSISQYKAYLAVAYDLIDDIVSAIEYVVTSVGVGKVAEISGKVVIALISIKGFIKILSDWLGVNLDETATAQANDIDSVLTRIEDKSKRLSSIQ